MFSISSITTNNWYKKKLFCSNQRKSKNMTINNHTIEKWRENMMMTIFSAILYQICCIRAFVRKQVVTNGILMSFTDSYMYRYLCVRCSFMFFTADLILNVPKPAWNDLYKWAFILVVDDWKLTFSIRWKYEFTIPFNMHMYYNTIIKQTLVTCGNGKNSQNIKIRVSITGNSVAAASFE